MRPSRFHRGSPNPTLCGPSPALPVVSDPAESQPSASARLYLLLSYEEWWFGYILKNDEIALHNHYGFTISQIPGPGFWLRHELTVRIPVNLIGKEETGRKRSDVAATLSKGDTGAILAG